jgi:hypothetical protein
MGSPATVLVAAKPGKAHGKPYPLQQEGAQQFSVCAIAAVGSMEVGSQQTALRSSL